MSGGIFVKKKVGLCLSTGTIVRTSQMKVKRSCHDAFLGSSARSAVNARTRRAATPAREYADVAVKTEWVDGLVSSISSSVCLGPVFSVAHGEKTLGCTEAARAVASSHFSSESTGKGLIISHNHTCSFWTRFMDVFRTL
jgi:hypothetical protein